MKKFVFFSLLLAASLSLKAQTSDLSLEKGVKAHKEIDAIYARLAKSYRELDASATANIYTEDANYLASGNLMVESRPKIGEIFSGFFDYVRQNGNTVEIKFQILQREVTDKLGYDVGIYTLDSFKDGKKVQTSQGKFFVVTKKIRKDWYFRFDGYSDMQPPKK